MGDREKFSTEELAIVLSHYDLGIIESIKEYNRGSRKAPKLLLHTDKGDFLLKRRARGKDDPFKVAFSHSLQLYLATKQFPLPHLIGTKSDNNSMLQYNGLVYEIFDYIPGNPYDNSLEATYESGHILALYHKLLLDYTSEFETPQGSYHANKSIATGFAHIPHTLSRSDRGPEVNDQTVLSTVKYLGEIYQEAMDKVEAAGFSSWPMQITHCDWHPGNMIYQHHKVVAVIDYDASRLQPRVIDIANGALQFSIIGGSSDPTQWPEYLDESRFKRFIRGYDSVDVISQAELDIFFWLMIEALVAESVLPIAATGSFGRMEGYGFLQMIERKVRWIHTNMTHLRNISN